MKYITFSNFILLSLTIFAIYVLVRIAVLAGAYSWFQAKSKFEKTNGNKRNEENKNG